jgi:hypothetical protein
MFLAVFVFPISSEKELRQLMLQSLQHVSVHRRLYLNIDPLQIETFGMLISRSYLMIITEEEKAMRDALSQSIRVTLNATSSSAFDEFGRRTLDS